jgi:hypothetical protein
MQSPIAGTKIENFRNLCRLFSDNNSGQGRQMEHVMGDSTSDNDRRRHARYPMSTSLQFHHGPSRRDIPGRSVDVSESGMLMYVPLTTPVRTGQAVYVHLAGIRGKPASNTGPVHATIVRVDREQMTSKGFLGIGIRFAAA